MATNYAIPVDVDWIIYGRYRIPSLRSKRHASAVLNFAKMCFELASRRRFNNFDYLELCLEPKKNTNNLQWHIRPQTRSYHIVLPEDLLESKLFLQKFLDSFCVTYKYFVFVYRKNGATICVIDWGTPGIIWM